MVRNLSTAVLLLGLLALPTLAKNDKLSEEQIKRVAAMELQRVQGLKLDLQGSTLIIYGTVTSYFEKRNAERDVARIRGVARVGNKLIVNPIARTDSQIKSDLNAALAAQAWFHPRKVAVKVVKNVVTLSGNVDSLREKNLIGEVVGSVRGVKDVVNNISVVQSKSAQKPNDESIKRDVELLLIAELGESVARAITVETAKGLVTLRGAVANYWEKIGAYRAAESVVGVTGVTNLLEIE
jgi:osmotically-inducible protein OsmY